METIIYFGTEVSVFPFDLFFLAKGLKELEQGRPPRNLDTHMCGSNF